MRRLSVLNFYISNLVSLKTVFSLSWESFCGDDDSVGACFILALWMKWLVKSVFFRWKYSKNDWGIIINHTDLIITCNFPKLQYLNMQAGHWSLCGKLHIDLRIAGILMSMGSSRAKYFSLLLEIGVDFHKQCLILV